MTYFLPSNIIKLLNTFELPEDNITVSNYEAAFNHLNSSYPETVLGLDIKTCDMQTLLSEVTTSMDMHHIKVLFVFLLLCALFLICACAGSGGNRPGLHRLHRGNNQDAWISGLVCSLLHHASLLGTLDPVWQHRGSGGSTQRSECIP